jgi:hypothetical protein
MNLFLKVIVNKEFSFLVLWHKEEKAQIMDDKVMDAPPRLFRI